MSFIPLLTELGVDLGENGPETLLVKPADLQRTLVHRLDNVAISKDFLSESM